MYVCREVMRTGWSGVDGERVKKRKRVSGIKHHVILLGERISLKPANENKPVAAIFIIVIIIIIFFF